MTKAFQLNMECSVRARRFWSMQNWAKLRNMFNSGHLTRLPKGTYRVRLLRNKRRLMPFLFRSELWQILVLFKPFWQRFMHLTCTVSCGHAYILFGLTRQMGRLDAGNPSFNRNLIRALPHPTYRSANATPSAAILTHLGIMVNSWNTDNERDRPFQKGSG